MLTSILFGELRIMYVWNPLIPPAILLKRERASREILPGIPFLPRMRKVKIVKQ